MSLKCARLSSQADASTVVQNMQTADVVCFLTHPGSVHPIATFQAQFAPPYSADAARVTHVAIYVGQDKIVHSLKSGGVQCDDFWSFAKSYGTVEIAVGRVPGLTASEQLAICGEANRWIGQPYNSTMIRRLVQQSTTTKPSFAGPIAAANALDEMICSGLVERCFATALSATPFKQGSRYPVILPADIFMGPGLVDALP